MLGKTLLCFQIFLDNVQPEYGEIVNASEISNGIYEIDDVWNESVNEKVADKKRGKYHNIFLTDDDRSLSVSRNFYKNFKCDSPNTNGNIM